MDPTMPSNTADNELFLRQRRVGNKEVTAWHYARALLKGRFGEKRRVMVQWPPAEVLDVIERAVRRKDPQRAQQLLKEYSRVPNHERLQMNDRARSAWLNTPVQSSAMHANMNTTATTNKFVRNTTRDLAVILAHGCLLSSQFVIPPRKIVILIGRPGENNKFGFIDALLLEKKVLLDVIDGKPNVTLNGLPLYTVVAREGDIISDTELYFDDDEKMKQPAGVYLHPTEKGRLLFDPRRELTKVGKRRKCRLSYLLTQTCLEQRPGAYICVSCRANCYSDNLVVQRAFQHDAAIRSRTPDVLEVNFIPNQLSASYAEMLRRFKKAERRGGPNGWRHIFPLWLPLKPSEEYLADNADFNKAAADFQQGARAFLSQRPDPLRLTEVIFIKNSFMTIRKCCEQATLLETSFGETMRSMMGSVRLRRSSVNNKTRQIEEISATKRLDARYEAERDLVYEAAAQFRDQPFALVFAADGTVLKRAKMRYAQKIGEASNTLPTSALCLTWAQKFAPVLQNILSTVKRANSF